MVTNLHVGKERLLGLTLLTHCIRVFWVRHKNNGEISLISSSNEDIFSSTSLTDTFNRCST